MRAVSASVGGLTQTQYKLWVSGELAARPALASYCSPPLPTEVPSTKLCCLTLLTSQHLGSPFPFQNLWGLPLVCLPLYEMPSIWAWGGCSWTTGLPPPPAGNVLGCPASAPPIRWVGRLMAKGSRGQQTVMHPLPPVRGQREHLVPGGILALN